MHESKCFVPWDVGYSNILKVMPELSIGQRKHSSRFSEKGVGENLFGG